MVSTEGYEEHEKRHWDQSVEEIDRYSSVGVQGYPKKINKYRKEALFPIIQKTLSENGSPIGSSTLLDAGCGTGIYSEWYSNNGAEVFGVDLSERAIETIDNLGISGTYQQSPLDDLPFDEQQFNVVHCFSVLYHIVDDEQWEESVRELARVLKPSGLMLLRIEWVEETERVAKRRKLRHQDWYVDVLEEYGVVPVEVIQFPDQPMFKKLTTRLPTKNIPIISKLSSIFTVAAVKFDLFRRSEQERLVVFRKESTRTESN